jgi:hypothetical protein
MSEHPRSRRVTVFLIIVVLTTVTGCWSFHSFVNALCPGCPPYRIAPVARPAE